MTVSDTNKQAQRITATACPLDCPDTCGVLAEADDQGRLVALRGNPAHGYSRGTLCGKTAIFADVVHAPERLSHPLVRNARGELERASWDEALDRAATGLRGLHGTEILALCYAGCMGLVARGYPMRLMHALGAVTTDGAICDSTASRGYELTLGHAIGPDPETLEDSDLVLLWGIDARRTAQHLVPRVKSALARGSTVIVVDIYHTETARAVESWGGRALILKPGTDAALALALARAALTRGVVDREAVERECVGLEELEAELHSAAQDGASDRYQIEWAASECGLQIEQIEALYTALTRAQRPFLKTGVGWTRRAHGGAGMRAVCSLAALLGHADRVHYETYDHFGFDDSVVRRPELRTTPASDPIRHVELGRELESGRFRAAVVWGHNPAATVPDARRVRSGLQRPDLFLVVHELFLTATARLADVVLPSTAFVEQSDIYRSYGHRRLQYGAAASKPPADQRSNVATFRALGERLGLGPQMGAESEEQLCRALLEANAARFVGDERDRVLSGEPVKLAPRSVTGRGTPSGLVELASEQAERVGEPRIARYERDEGATGGSFWLIAAPSVATHNSTYLHSPRHRARLGVATVFLHSTDAARLGIAAGDRVRVGNEQARLRFTCQLSDDLPVGCVRIDGFPLPEEIGDEAGINALMSSRRSDVGDGNVLYSTRVDVEPCTTTDLG